MSYWLSFPRIASTFTSHLFEIVTNRPQTVVLGWQIDVGRLPSCPSRGMLPVCPPRILSFSSRRLHLDFPPWYDLCGIRHVGSNGQDERHPGTRRNSVYEADVSEERVGKIRGSYRLPPWPTVTRQSMRWKIERVSNARRIHTCMRPAQVN